MGNTSESCGGAYRILVFSVGCDPDWGWLTVIFIAVIAVLYMGGGTMYNHQIHGSLGGDALPNTHFWANLYGQVDIESHRRFHLPAVVLPEAPNRLKLWGWP